MCQLSSWLQHWDTTTRFSWCGSYVNDPHKNDAAVETERDFMKFLPKRKQPNELAKKKRVSRFAHPPASGRTWGLDRLHCNCSTKLTTWAETITPTNSTCKEMAELHRRDNELRAMFFFFWFGTDKRVKGFILCISCFNNVSENSYRLWRAIKCSALKVGDLWCPNRKLVTTRSSQHLLAVLKDQLTGVLFYPVLEGKLKSSVFARGCKHRANHGLF